MNMHDPIVAARLALLPFALVQWTVVFVYVKLMLRPEIATPLRVILLGPFIVAMVGTVFGQLNVYTAMTRVANPLETDDVRALAGGDREPAGRGAPDPHGGQGTRARCGVHPP